MTKLTRDQLINEYVQNTIDSMDLDDCLAVLHDYLTKTYETYSTEEIIEEVTEYYPEILEN